MLPRLPPTTARAPAGRADPSRAPGLRAWLGLTAILFAAEACWTLATPLFAGADEPTQIIKAAAVVRGQVIPRPVHPGATFTSVRVPAAFAGAGDLPLCYIFRPTVPASCMGTFPPASSHDPATTVDARTYVGRYPPLYYALVGWPSFAFADATGVYLMRLAGGLWCAAALALALVVAARYPGASARSTGGFLTVGVTLAATPTVLFTGAVVNPNGLEACAAIALWSCLARLAGGSGRPENHLVVATALSATVTAAMRGLSPFWVVLTAFACAAFAGRRRLADLAHCRPVRRLTVAVIAVLAASSAWIVWAGSLDLLGVRCALHCPTYPGAAVHSLSMTSNYLLQLVGVFGWVILDSSSTVRDTTAPLAVLVGWGAVVALIAAFAFRSAWSSRAPTPAPRREGAALAACVAATIVVPALVQASQADHIGYIWQGRYLLPFAVGIPVLAAATLERARIPARAVTCILLCLGAFQLLALWWPLHRYAVGTGGPLWFVGRSQWSPPIPAPALAAVLAAALAAWYGWVRSRVTTAVGASTR